MSSRAYRKQRIHDLRSQCNDLERERMNTRNRDVRVNIDVSNTDCLTAIVDVFEQYIQRHPDVKIALSMRSTRRMSRRDSMVRSSVLSSRNSRDVEATVPTYSASNLSLESTTSIREIAPNNMTSETGREESEHEDRVIEVSEDDETAAGSSGKASEVSRDVTLHARRPLLQNVERHVVVDDNTGNVRVEWRLPRRVASSESSGGPSLR